MAAAWHPTSGRVGESGKRVLTLFVAMVLDALLGEPKWLWSRLPHPAVLMGRAIDRADQRFNSGTARKGKGGAVMAGFVGAAALIGLALQAIPGVVVDIVVLAILLAQRSLCDHVIAVAKALTTSLRDGQEAVAQIVGRDTKNMDESAVARSAIESGAENLSDGVIAPIFWFVIAGLPGLLIYKISNTADSMIGYKTERHADFGWAAARFDDALNYLPARITAVLMAVSLWRVDTLGEVAHDAPAHRSPNAGWPEAAMAYALNIALSGPRMYDGQLREYPFVNEDGIRELRARHIREAVRVLWQTWALVLIPAGIAAWVFAAN